MYMILYKLHCKKTAGGRNARLAATLSLRGAMCNDDGRCDSAATSGGLKTVGEVQMATTGNATLARRLTRRDFLKKSAGPIATASFGIARKAFAADPVNIGGL